MRQSYPECFHKKKQIHTENCLTGNKSITPKNIKNGQLRVSSAKNLRNKMTIWQLVRSKSVNNTKTDNYEMWTNLVPKIRRDALKIRYKASLYPEEGLENSVNVQQFCIQMAERPEAWMVANKIHNHPSEIRYLLPDYVGKTVLVKKAHAKSI